MELDRWIGSYKVRAFPWIDGKRIYFNVQYYAPGQSIEKPPVWDKTVYITDDAAGRDMVKNLTSSLTEFVSSLKIPDERKILLTACERSVKS
jgi:hypothetical protein